MDEDDAEDGDYKLSSDDRNYAGEKNDGLAKKKYEVLIQEMVFESIILQERQENRQYHSSRRPCATQKIKKKATHDCK